MEPQSIQVTDDLRRAAVREYFRWHLGSRRWAESYEHVWANPVASLTRLAEEQRGFTHEAAAILGIAEANA